jgi:hypothetical protein
MTLEWRQVASTMALARWKRSLRDQPCAMAIPSERPPEGPGDYNRNPQAAVRKARATRQRKLGAVTSGSGIFRSPFISQHSEGQGKLIATRSKRESVLQPGSTCRSTDVSTVRASPVSAPGQGKPKQAQASPSKPPRASPISKFGAR